VLEGDPSPQTTLEAALRGAFAATEAYGAWPPGAWRVRLHLDGVAFEQATGAPTARSAQWVGEVLHLRPWEQLRRRPLGAILRHELTHRRLQAKGLRRWSEEARCLWAEVHPRPPKAWPPAPSQALQARLDRALAGGTTKEQDWAYRWLRAWLKGEAPPTPPQAPRRETEVWKREALQSKEPVTVVWPSERLRGPMVVNGQRLAHRTGHVWRFRGRVRFPEGFPVRELRGRVAMRAEARGWSLAWTTNRAAWIAAATEGELGPEAPWEARRALAALLDCWLEGHGHQHPGGRLCPLTHCAVVRGQPSTATQRAAASAPALDLDPRWAFFAGSAGGQSLSPRAVWGEGPAEVGLAAEVPGDRWLRWEQRLSAAQVARLKQDVAPGLRSGQSGLRLGDSGPYAVEALRLVAGRAFGWTVWPSNACEAELQPDGSLLLNGRGWGHNVGLCLATARFRAGQGATAEQILAEAFPTSWRRP
jgi:stage II sporulation protein D